MQHKLREFTIRRRVEKSSKTHVVAAMPPSRSTMFARSTSRAVRRQIINFLTPPSPGKLSHNLPGAPMRKLLLRQMSFSPDNQLFSDDTLGGCGNCALRGNFNRRWEERVGKIVKMNHEKVWNFSI